MTVEGEVTDELLQESRDSGMGRIMLFRPQQQQQGQGEEREERPQTGKTSGARDQGAEVKPRQKIDTGLLLCR